MTEYGSEKRKAPRYNGALPVELGSSRGVTRDYSIAGVFFYIDVQLAQGDPVNFSMIFNHLDAGRQMRVNCHGTVVRSSRERERYGVAVQLNSHSFGI